MDSPRERAPPDADGAREATHSVGNFDLQAHGELESVWLGLVVVLRVGEDPASLQVDRESIVPVQSPPRVSLRIDNVPTAV